MSIVTRFAPSPTGFLHLGNVRTAIFNYLFALKNQGKFIVRIEDTDKERSDDAFIGKIVEDLTFLGLKWQMGPGLNQDKKNFQQSARNEHYHKFISQLEQQEAIYKCFCSQEKLKLMRRSQLAAGEPPKYNATCSFLSESEIQEKLKQNLSYVVRFKVPQNKIIELDDLVKGKQVFNTKDIGDFVIAKSDFTPTFFFSNAIDDSLMKISHVFRGDDHLTNTPRQMLILESLKLTIPKYGHTSTILGEDSKPLSKRNGSQSIQDLKQQGIIPSAINNYLARLGCVYTQNDFFSFEQLAHNFEINNLVSAPSKYDKNTLDFWQQSAWQNFDDVEKKKWFDKTLVRLGLKCKENEYSVLYQLTQQNKINDEIVKANYAIITDILDYEKAYLKFDLSKIGVDVLLEAAKLCEQHSNWQDFIGAVKKGTGKKGKELFLPIRLALTLSEHGAEMKVIYEFLDKKIVKKRINQIIQYINNN